MATKKQQQRVGRSKTPHCPLCGTTEDRRHLFCCTNPMSQQLREHMWLKLIQNLGKHTADGVYQVFISGLQTVLGSREPDTRTKGEWPDRLRQVFEQQSLIGWDQVFYGRIAGQWESVVSEGSASGDNTDWSKWTCRAIRLCWDFGINLWVMRNHLVHGTGTGISQEEIARVDRLTESVYEAMKYQLTDLEKKALQYNRLDTDGDTSSYAYKKAWLAHVRFLHPDKFRSIVHAVTGTLENEVEIENRQFREMGSRLNFDIH